MKSNATKNEFIQLRADGLSYAKIAEQLHISKATCQAWEKALADQISETKRERLTELAENYGITKEARIKRLGETLDGINAALAETDFLLIPPEKLLELKLKYTEALKAEYIGTSPAFAFGDSVTDKGIVNALGDLLNRIRSGDITAEQANKEASVLTQLLKAYDTVHIKSKVDELETLLHQKGNTPQWTQN